MVASARRTHPDQFCRAQKPGCVSASVCVLYFDMQQLPVTLKAKLVPGLQRPTPMSKDQLDQNSHGALAEAGNILTIRPWRLCFKCGVGRTLWLEGWEEREREQGANATNPPEDPCRRQPVNTPPVDPYYPFPLLEDRLISKGSKMSAYTCPRAYGVA